MGKLAPPMVLGHWLAALAMALGPTGGAGYDVGDRPFRQTGTACPGGGGWVDGGAAAQRGAAQRRAGQGQPRVSPIEVSVSGRGHAACGGDGCKAWDWAPAFHRQKKE